MFVNVYAVPVFSSSSGMTMFSPHTPPMIAASRSSSPGVWLDQHVDFGVTEPCHAFSLIGPCQVAVHGDLLTPVVQVPLVLAIFA